MDMSEGQTLWSDSNGTSNALSEDNDVLGRPGHNTATGSSSYEPSPPKVKRKSWLVGWLVSNALHLAMKPLTVELSSIY